MIKIAITGMMPDGITPDYNQIYWIAGDPLKTNAEHSGIFDESRSISRRVSPEAGTEFAFVIPHDAKNEQLSLSFSTTRTFTTILANWRWRNAFSKLLESDWNHPCYGDAIMRFELANDQFEEVILRKVYVAKPGMKADGVSLELSYNLQGGEIVDLGAALLAYPLADGGAEIVMKLFGTVSANSVTDGASVSGSISSVPVGTVIAVQGIDNVSSVTITKNFEIVSGGSPAPGNIAVDHPLVDNLADIAAAYSGETHMSATVVSDGVRAYVALNWLTEPTGDADEVRITVTILAAGYEATTTAEDYDASVFPVDDGDEYPVAGDDT
jgi:hypothetical protein